MPGKMNDPRVKRIIEGRDKRKHILALEEISTMMGEKEDEGFGDLPVYIEESDGNLTSIASIKLSDDKECILIVSGETKTN